MRYPNSKEIDCCFENLINEIKTLNPKIIFLLGEKVYFSVGKHLDIRFEKWNNFDYGDLVYLFATHKPNYDGERPVAFVRADKKEEFAKALISRLQEQSLDERDCVRWAESMEDVFDEFLEEDCPFLKYGEIDGFSDEEIKAWEKLL